jgi:hypothetical protein
MGRPPNKTIELRSRNDTPCRATADETPRSIPGSSFLLKTAGVTALFGIAGWLFQTFLQLRGVVDVVASRVVLAFFGCSLFVMVCILTTHLLRRVVYRSFTAFAILLLVFGLDIWATCESGHSTQLTSTVLREQAVKELTEINDFIVKKDEDQLRETFDFRRILEFNIRLFKKSTNLKALSRGQLKEMNDFFKGGSGVLDMRFVKVYALNNVAHVEWLPGKIGVINASVKYMQNRSKLAGFISSSQLPSSVTEALKDFDEVVSRNFSLMCESLNKSLSDDPRNILENDVYSSPRYG